MSYQNNSNNIANTATIITNNNTLNMNNTTMNTKHIMGDSGNTEHVYFSRITQQWEPVWFYATMLKKLNSFAQTIDRSAASSRELVWSHVYSLYNQPNRKCSDLFSPIIDEWCHNQSIDLSAIEIMYTSFLQIYNQYPSLFEVLPPSSSPSSSTSSSSSSQSLASDHSLSYSGYMSSDGNNKVSESKKDDSKQVKNIKLANTSLIWGNSFASSVQQFSLLLNWAPLLEKLPPNQKEAIWNTCQLFPLFSDGFDRTSFRKTFLKWSSNLPTYLSQITVLFAAIGFLRDKGFIKHQFFYPNTTVPVFNNGAKTSPNSMYFPSSPQDFSPASSPVSPSSPTRMSPVPSSAASSRSSSPTTPVHEFQGSQALHHFYPALSASSPHPVLPSLDGARSKSLPFDTLSLPPLSLPSTPSAPSPTPNNSSSRLGLLALAAFQADDTDPPAQPSTLSFPSLAPLKSLNSSKDGSPSPLIPKVEEQSSPETSTQVTPNTKDSKDKALPTPTIMKISKRKNSCSEFHDDESKRPRTMNLSHILCS